MIATIGIDLLAIIALCFTIIFANRNVIVNKHKTMVYVSAAVTTIVLLLLEIATVFMALSSDPSLVVPHRIVNAIGFSLCPVVPFTLWLFSSDMGIKTYRGLVALPLCVNAAMSVLSVRTGWIFSVGAQNRYTRGPLFLLSTAVGVFYFVFMAIAVTKNGASYDTDSKKALIPILSIPLLGVVAQVMFRDMLFIWGSVSISLLLYYIFMRELQFEYDAQTKLRNRSAFEKEMAQSPSGNGNVALIVVDINNLKKINDRHGHAVGDAMIVDTARIVQDSFVAIGKAFRIGGDEFCAICRDAPKELVDNALSRMNDLLIMANQKRSIRVVLAYGYAFSSGNESVHSAFVEADRAMYAHKARLKELHSRVMDD